MNISSTFVSCINNVIKSSALICVAFLISACSKYKLSPEPEFSLNDINSLTPNAKLGVDKGSADEEGEGNLVFKLKGITHIMPYRETKLFDNGVLYRQELLIYDNIGSAAELTEYLTTILGKPDQIAKISNDKMLVVWGGDSIDRGVLMLIGPTAIGLHFSIVSTDKKMGKGFWKK